jgi:hypothetical protein
MKGKGNRKEQRIRYKKKYPDKVRGYKRRYYIKLRLSVLIHYSQGHLKCSACGENHIEFLEIDHIYGGGNKHIAAIKTLFYVWLKRNGFPEGYQVLCSNCNIKKIKDAAHIKGLTGTLEQRKYFKRITKLKQNLFSHYMTDGKIKCACPGCNVTNPDLLCMDHKNSDGTEHRRSLGMQKGDSKGNRMYMWIKRNNYPPDFRVLCHNCNQSLGKYGYCPHENNFSIFKFLK